jgi:hypothetical protein
MSVLDLQTLDAANDVTPQWSLWSIVGCVSTISTSLCLQFDDKTP